MFQLKSRHVLYCGKIIVTIANYWRNEGFYAGSRDDLISEGWLVLIRLLREGYDFRTPTDLYKALSASVQRRYIDLYRRRVRDRVVLPDKEDFISQNALVAEHTAYNRLYLKDLVGFLSEYLSIRQRRVLRELIHPSKKTQQIALEDGRNRQKLHELGLPVKGYRTIVVRRRHVAESLGLSGRQMRKAVRVIRRVCLMTGVVTPRNQWLRENRL